MQATPHARRKLAKRAVTYGSAPFAVTGNRKHRAAWKELSHKDRQPAVFVGFLDEAVIKNQQWNVPRERRETSVLLIGPPGHHTPPAPKRVGQVCKRVPCHFGGTGLRHVRKSDCLAGSRIMIMNVTGLMLFTSFSSTCTWRSAHWRNWNCS